MQFQIVNLLAEHVSGIGIFTLVLFIFLLLGTVVRKILLPKFKILAEYTVTDFDDLIYEVVNSITIKFYTIIGALVGLSVINLPEKLSNGAEILLLLAVTYLVANILVKLINYFIEKMDESSHKGESVRSLSILKVLVKIVVWAVAVLWVLSNLGFEINSLLAGLGIGGVAIALAVQNVLSDFLAYFSIFFDKPFAIGDFIIVGQDMGVVEHVGLKTTRLRALQGEQLVIPNSDLLNSRISNYRKMINRRVDMSLGVTYETPNEKLEKIPLIIQKIIEEEPKASFDRCHFRSYGDFSLNYAIVYHVESSDYNVYMDVNQDINLKIKKAFEDEKIDFAYPTQLIYTKGN